MKMSKTIGVGIVALAVGLGVGYLLFAGTGGHGQAGAAAEDSGLKTLYTCGMHPDVIQDHPGDCPQCHMRLTPLKVDQDEGGAAGKKDRKILYWVAPMDPGYVRDKPGKSPMGMDLVPVYQDEVSGGPSVKIDPVTEQNMGIRTAPVVKGPLVHEVRTVGNVQYDERRIGIVTLKVAGYVEKLHVDETGVRVKKGDPLFDMYAPDVVQAQDEYLRTKQNFERASGEDRARWGQLLDQSRMKLLRWDLSEAQITELEERGTSKKVMTWRSPFDGVVVHKNVFEGAYFKPGEQLYRIASIDTVWVYVSIYEFEFPWVKVGQQARMQLPYYPGETFTGTVEFIYPYLDPKSRDRKVRLIFENPGYELVPDMFATVYVAARLADEATLVPSEAVLDTGRRQIVFVAAGKGKFDPREVRVGVRSEGGLREVLKGLVPGEQVVTSGQFLLDSESKIKEAIQKMLARRQAGGKAAPPPAEAAGAGDGVAAIAGFGAPEGMIPVVAETCPVLGGKPVPDVYVDHGRYRIFLCCAGCPDRFRAEPEKYLEKLRRMGALPEDKPGAAADPRFKAPEGMVAIVPRECPVMGGEPDPEVYVDHGRYRIFLCCAGCPDEFRADPEKFLKKLREAGALPADDGGETAAPTLYTCAMHPEVVQDHPGKCPQCGMELTPVQPEDEREAGNGEDR